MKKLMGASVQISSTFEDAPPSQENVDLVACASWPYSALDSEDTAACSEADDDDSIGGSFGHPSDSSCDKHKRGYKCDKVSH